MNYYDEEVLERDMGNDNPEGLPTYDYLHEQERANPNSRLVGFAIERIIASAHPRTNRFGRWKGWVEKR